MLVSPRRNQISSCTIDFRCSFLVVTSGKPSARSKRICRPNTLRVPVPVRSAFSVPCSSTWRRRSRYWRIRRLRAAAVAAARQRRRAARQPKQHDADDDQRQRQDLAHRQPVERDETELHVGLAHELDAEAEQAVKQREQTRHRITRPRLARIEPEHREQHDAFEAEFVELRGMPRFVVRAGRRDTSGADRPGSCRATSSARGKIMPHGASVCRPQSSPPMKLPSRPRPSPIGTSGATKSMTSKKLSWLRRDQISAPASTPSRPPWNDMPPSQTRNSASG